MHPKFKLVLALDRMEILNSPQDFLFNLQTCSPNEAKRMWKESIKERWNHECAYCGSKTNELSIDHIVPRSKGGNDHITNVLCACTRCNRSKAHEPVEQWYRSQKFFTEERYDAIIKWQRQYLNQDFTNKLMTYKPRRNRVA